MKKFGLLTCLGLLLILGSPLFAQFEWAGTQTPVAENLNDVVMASENVIYAVGNNGVILKSSDAGLTYDVQNTWEGFHLNAIHAIDEQRVWIVGENSLIYTTLDGGTTWNFQLLDFPATFTDVYFIDENKGFLVYDDLDDNDRLRILFTTDGGLNWNHANLPLQVDIPTGMEDVTSYRYRTAIDFPTPNVGYLCFTNGILKTTDGGLNWSFQIIEAQEGYEFTGSFPVALDFIDETNGIVVSPFQKAIGYTQDGCNSLRMSDHTYQYGGYDVNYLSSNNAYVVGDVDFTIYHLTNGGQNVATSFSIFGSEPDSTRRFFAVDFWNEELGIAVGGHGKIARFSEVVNGVTTVENAPIEVYPNPVRELLQIQMPENWRADVQTISLFNSVGQEILQERRIDNLTEINTQKLAKGVYWLHIQLNDGRVVNRKVVKG